MEYSLAYQRFSDGLLYMHQKITKLMRNQSSLFILENSWSPNGMIGRVLRYHSVMHEYIHMIIGKEILTRNYRRRRKLAA